MKRTFPLLIILFLFLLPKVSSATSLSLGPSSGTFSVGSTFSVSVLLNTEGKSINALSVFLTYPADKLQVVSPSVGQSIIDVWTVPPKFNNITGSIEFEGGIPGGIIASRGVLTNITFRVKSVGEAIIKFSDKSRVFLDDGKATDDLSKTGNAVYSFKLPPPQGPIVVSETHPDQSVWYSNPNVSLHFANEASGVSGYSYVLNDDPVGTPDNISEGTKNAVVYSSLSDGTHYFHIKSLRGDVWGGVTHFAINVDVTPPAEFPISLFPGARTTNTRPIIEWSTTDSDSGLDHYELKAEPLSFDALQSVSPDGGKVFFVEATSPYVSTNLTLGSYNVIVRAFDKAGNYQEITKKLVITTPLFSIVGDEGIRIKNFFTIPWLWVWIILLILLGVLGYVAYEVWLWHKDIHKVGQRKALPQSVSAELEELKKYRLKYGAKAAIILLALFSALHFNSIDAQVLELTPPLISTYSQNITNQEIFYVGGHAAKSKEVVVLYSQNILTGETLSYEVEADKGGEWFYRNDAFLAPGDYILWVQSKSGDQFSAPSSQVKMRVSRAAIQFGPNRLSLEAIYFTLLILVLLIAGVLVAFIIYHSYQAKRKYKKFQKEIREAEDSVSRGFALLKRDIEEELAAVRRAQPGGELSPEEKAKESELLNDLTAIQKKIGQEIWEIRATEN